MNIRNVVRLLEGNLKNEEFPTLKLEAMTVYYPEELQDLLKHISEAKTGDSNLKIELAFEFHMEYGRSYQIEYLDEFCGIIESRAVKGLEISFKLYDCRYLNHYFDEVKRVKRVLEKYPRMRNFALIILYPGETLEYVKRDGEKEQFFLHSS